LDDRDVNAEQALLAVIIIGFCRDGVIIYVLIAWIISLYRGTAGAAPVGAAPVRPGPVPVPAPVAPAAIPQPPLSGAKGSWYSQYQGKYSWVDDGDAPGSNALRVPDSDQGISFPSGTALGHWFELHTPDGIVSIEQQTDIGPGKRTGRGIDISAACAERCGYSPKNFPTDATFQWRPVAAPASVANLSPVAQAIAYHAARGTPGADAAPVAAPVAAPAAPAAVPPWIVRGRTFNENTPWSSGPMPPGLRAWMDNISTTFPEMAPYCVALKALGAKGWFAWCGFFVQAMLSYSGIPGPISAQGEKGETTTSDWAYVDAWRTWGTKVWDAADGGDIYDAIPQPGDVLVWYVPGVIHHVSFYDHEDNSTNTFASLGGDQGSPLRVCIEGIPMSECVAIRRPVWNVVPGH
jgi:hypothetical protein